MSPSKQNRKRPVIPAKPRKRPTESLPEWGERMRRSGRALPLIMLAQLIMDSQREVYQGFLELRSGKLQQEQYRISHEIRRQYYLNRNAMWDDLLEVFARMISDLVTGDSLTPPLEVERFWKLWDKATPDSRRRLVEILKRACSDPRTIAIFSEKIETAWNKIYPAHLELLQNDSLESFSENLSEDPAVRFLLFYDFPCMLYFGRTSQEMFAEAAAGKLSAVTDLLLIDKELEFIDEIGKHTSPWRFQRDEVKLTALAQATRKSLPGKFAPRWLMYRMTHFLIDLSDELAEACFSRDSIRFTHTDLYQLLEIVCPFRPGDDACVPETLEQFRDGLKDNQEKMTSVTVWGR